MSEFRDKMLHSVLHKILDIRGFEDSRRIRGLIKSDFIRESVCPANDVAAGVQQSEHVSLTGAGSNLGPDSEARTTRWTFSIH